LIFANILKGPLIDLSQPMAQHIQKGGHAILSGILNEQANDVIKAYEGAGFTMINRDIIGEWTTLTLQFG
jgi:ribosomal protein L11 methyltransferase